MKVFLILLSLPLTSCGFNLLDDGRPGISFSRRESQQRQVYLHDYEVVSCSNPKLEPFVKKGISAIWAEKFWSHTIFWDTLNDTRSYPFDTTSNRIIFKMNPYGKKILDEDFIDFQHSHDHQRFTGTFDNWLIYSYPRMNPKDILVLTLIKFKGQTDEVVDSAKVTLRKVQR